MINALDYLTHTAALVNHRLDALLPTGQEAYHRLFEAARYALLGGGKRLRPCLLLATVEVLGGDLAAALQPACALEFIHAYSMVHDDLPCMDDDDFRRGRPTLHRVYPEGHAVLTGDYLLTRAFELIADAPYLSPLQRMECTTILAQRAGGHGMIGGQLLDIESEGVAVALPLLKQIHLLKTAALITAAVEMGSVVAEAPEHERERLSAFAREIGLAFQIVDDILDVTASEQKHGKPKGSDAANGKTTYVTLLGVEEAQRHADLHLTNALAQLEELSQDTVLLRAIAHSMTHRSS